MKGKNAQNGRFVFCVRRGEPDLIIGYAILESLVADAPTAEGVLGFFF